MEKKEKLETAAIQQGACRFCGQIISFETLGQSTPEQLDEWAVEKCDCSTAKNYTRRKKSIEGARKKIKQLFSSGDGEEAAALILNMAVDAISTEMLAEVSVNLGNGCKGKVSQSSKGNIRVERTDTKKISYEE